MTEPVAFCKFKITGIFVCKSEIEEKIFEILGLGCQVLVERLCGICQTDLYACQRGVRFCQRGTMQT
uniref:Uncharacterized protein n=1 Tax=Manihot esculenta TaxID=3983 RepID=A0A2C9VWB1_MANES